MGDSQSHYASGSKLESGRVEDEETKEEQSERQKEPVVYEQQSAGTLVKTSSSVQQESPTSENKEKNEKKEETVSNARLADFATDYIRDVLESMEMVERDAWERQRKEEMRIHQQRLDELHRRMQERQQSRMTRIYEEDDKTLKELREEPEREKIHRELKDLKAEITTEENGILKVNLQILEGEQDQKMETTESNIDLPKSRFQTALEIFCNSVISQCKARFASMKFTKNDGTEAHLLRHFLQVESEILKFQMRTAGEELNDVDWEAGLLQFTGIPCRVKSKQLVYAYLQNMRRDLEEMKENVDGPNAPTVMAFLVLSLWNQERELQDMGVEVFENETLDIDARFVRLFLFQLFDSELRHLSLSSRRSSVFVISNIFEKVFKNLKLKSIDDVTREYFSDE